MFDNYGIMGGEPLHKRFMQEIYAAERLYREHKQKLEDYQELVRLTRSNLIDKINQERSVYDAAPELINRAQEELKSKDSLEETPALDWLNMRISEDFFDSAIKISCKEILWFGLEEYSVIVRFNISNREYEISVPLKGKMLSNPSDFDRNYTYGKFALAWQDGPCSWEVLISSYDIDDVKEYIRKNLGTPWEGIERCVNIK